MAVRGAYTNTVPIDAYRGAGKPEAAYLLERLIDEAAYASPASTGWSCGAGTCYARSRIARRWPPPSMAVASPRNIDPALALADAAGFPTRRVRVTGGPTPRLRRHLFPGNRARRTERGRGDPLPPGRPRCRCTLGTQSNGQGHETSFPQIAADRLGLPIEAFRFIQADTREVRAGHGHGGARSLHMGGSALVDALGLVMGKARPVAARLLQARPEEVAFAAGQFSAGERSVGILEVARAAASDPEGEALDSYHWTLLDIITFPNGCHVAEVEVDTETGAVRLLRYSAADDFGAAVNPLLLLGQVQGGLAQGIGQALTERTVYDRQSGQLASGSFMDYCLPRAADLPDLTVELLGVPTAANPLGVKGAGQAGAIASPQAVVAAVLDALSQLGVTHIDMPLTPERVWQAIQAAA